MGNKIGSLENRKFTNHLFLKSINKKGDGADLLRNNVAYFIIFILFFIGMFFFVSSRMNNVSFWEDFYAKEIVRAVDFAEPGDIVKIDVTLASKLASKNGKSLDKAFVFDNEGGMVIVSLGTERGKSFNYFNNVSIESEGIGLSNENVKVNQLRFRVNGK